MVKSIYTDMFDNTIHIGHKTQKWNPLMKKYIYGEKQGMHIINLEKTLVMFESALEYMQKCVSEGKTILFVSTKPQSTALLKDLASTLNMPYVTNKWIPGLITNFDSIKTRIKYYLNLKEQDETGELTKYTKKEASKMRKELEALETALGGVKDMTTLPDVVFVVDVVRDAIVVSEARKLRIPVVAFTDTNADPTKITYPIPANDDSINSLTYLLGKIKETLSKKNK